MVTDTHAFFVSGRFGYLYGHFGTADTMNVNKSELARKIQDIEGLTNEEKTALLGLLHEHKKYGLVWEEKTEDIKERMRDELPVLIERNDEKVHPIISDKQDAPNHLIIEGDNLAALTELSYTHAGKIDVIYIDPPYNTGNKDFIYNDFYVDSEDSYRHSKWLSFMSKRLRKAKKLLSNRGLIFISIDDNEQANLKILCDEIFGQRNYIGVLPTIMNLKGNQDEFGFAGAHEYTLVYSKSKEEACIGQLPLEEDECLDWEIDDRGFYKRGASLKSTGVNAPREKRPNLYFPVFIDENDNVLIPPKSEIEPIYDKVTKIFNDEYLSDLISSYSANGFSCLLPLTGKEGMSWRWSRDKMANETNEIIVVHSRNELTIYKKQRPQLGDLPTKKPKSFLYKPEYSSGNGKTEIGNVLENNVFGYPKPLALIKDLVILGSGKQSIILDFFAGSGTTLHAVMQLNAEDGGKRQCILCNNNENGICENVTYERNKRVIEGYTKPNGEHEEGLHDNNLRYYRTEFLPRERTVKNMRRLMEASTGLLCIKNDLYTEAPFGDKKMNPKFARYFEKDGKRMLIIYEERSIPVIADIIKRMPEGEKIKVYVFSYGSYAYDDEFAEVLDRVILCALPQAIYDAYKNVLPKRKPQLLVEELVEEIEPSETHENQGLFAFDNEAEEESI